MEDFAIVIDNQTGHADLADGLSPVSTLMNNIFLSLTIIKGTWFHRTEFGIERRERLKNTVGNARLVQQDCQKALQWLLDTKRATSIDVFVERDRIQDLSRLKILVQARQADGRVVTFITFKEVV